MRTKVSDGRLALRGAARVVAGLVVSGVALQGSIALAQTPGGGAAGAARTRGGMAGATPQLDKLTLPAGFSVAIYASGVQGARSMALAPDGTLFIGTRANKVYAVVDANKDNVAEKVTELFDHKL